METIDSAPSTPQPSTPRLAAKRLAASWKLLLSVFFGILVATTLAAGTPVYLDSLDQLAFHSSLDSIPGTELEITVTNPNVVLAQKALQRVDNLVSDATRNHISEIQSGRERFLIGEVSVVGTPRRPIPEGGGTGVLTSRGYFQFLAELEEHSRFVEGQMASAGFDQGPGAPSPEAVISTAAAGRFGLAVGDEVGLAPQLGVIGVVVARIVGVFEPADPAEQFWADAARFLDPPPLDEEPPLLVQVDPEEPPLALFVQLDVISQLTGGPQGSAIGLSESSARTPTLLLGLPSRPLPESGGRGIIGTLGQLTHLSNLETHSKVTEGARPRPGVRAGAQGPELDAVLPMRAAQLLGLKVGDTVTLAPTLGASTLITSHIVGIIEAVDFESQYWGSAGVFLNPSTPGQTTPEGEPDEASLELQITSGPLLLQTAPGVAMVPLLVPESSMLAAVGQAYPGSLARVHWSIVLDKERLKGWAASDARRRFRDFEEEVIRSMPGATVGTQVLARLTNAGERSSFFSRVPFMLILSVTFAVVVFLLAMLVSYLVRSRDGDAALLKSRGAGAPQLLQLYSLEGLVMTVVAVSLAPVLAMGIVAVAGAVPPFRELTGGAFLPVLFSPATFLVSLAAGLLCLVILVAPSVSGSRAGPLLQRLRLSRPSDVSFLQRYYVDVALVVIGGLVFWELNQRGHIVTGGLFTDVEINETLLLAPLLFMVAVALVFMRFFPLVVRFVAGESRSLVHLTAGATVPILAAGLLIGDLRGDESIRVLPPLLVALAGGAYWVTQYLAKRSRWLVGVAVQAGLVALFISGEFVERGHVLFVPFLVFAGLVPAQLAYLLFRLFTRASPLWVSMALWRMSRTPMQYTWLVLLLVLSTGLSILATTVGGTLERSERERVLYEAPTDIRIHGLPIGVYSPAAEKQEYIDLPGVEGVSLAFRTAGTVGPRNVEILAIEPQDFADLSWYRDDFSDRPLAALMADLGSNPIKAALRAPEGAQAIGIWVKPLGFFPFASLFLEVEDINERRQTIFLGQLGTPEWTRMSGEVSDELQQPLRVISLLMFEQAAGGPVGGTPATSGSLLLDDLHAVLESGEQRVFDDFEAAGGWDPILLSGLGEDAVSLSSGDAFRGDGAARLTVGNATLRGLRGMYRSPSRAPVPVVVSSSFADAGGYRVGNRLELKLENQIREVFIVGIAHYFPTLDPEEVGFMVMNYRDLTEHLNVLLEYMRVLPNEMFVGDTPERHEEVIETLKEVVTRSGKVTDGRADLESIRRDPFTTAGWKPMAILAPGVGVMAAAVGYVTYLLLFAAASRREMGSLRSMGLSRVQMIALLGGEHLTIAAVGIALGTWAGYEMSALMVSPLAITDTGVPVVPPFLLTTNWVLMFPAYLALAGIFVGSWLVLSRGMGRAELSSLARAGEV